MKTLQINLPIDESLKKDLELLKFEYSNLDENVIVQLALRSFAKKISNKLFYEFMDEIYSRKEGMSEKECIEWWNKNKKSLDE